MIDLSLYADADYEEIVRFFNAVTSNSQIPLCRLPRNFPGREFGLKSASQPDCMRRTWLQSLGVDYSVSRCNVGATIVKTQRRGGIVDPVKSDLSCRTVTDRRRTFVGRRCVDRVRTRAAVGRARARITGRTRTPSVSRHTAGLPARPGLASRPPIRSGSGSWSVDRRT